MSQWPPCHQGTVSSNGLSSQSCRRRWCTLVSPRPARSDGVKVLVKLLELQLAFRDLVEGDTQQAVLMELADVVKPWTE